MYILKYLHIFLQISLYLFMSTPPPPFIPQHKVPQSKCVSTLSITSNQICSGHSRPRVMSGAIIMLSQTCLCPHYQMFSRATFLITITATQLPAHWAGPGSSTWRDGSDQFLFRDKLVKLATRGHGQSWSWSRGCRASRYTYLYYLYYLQLSRLLWLTLTLPLWLNYHWLLLTQ